MAEKRLEARVFGFVQGVFFRSYVKHWAEQFGLKGYAQNMPDSSVEVIVEGEEKKLEQMLEKLRLGPPTAAVERVDIKWDIPKKEFQKFEMRFWA